MARPRPFIRSSLAGGINLEKSPLELEDHESPDLYNVQRLGEGQDGVRKRTLDRQHGTQVTGEATNQEYVTLMPVPDAALLHNEAGKLISFPGYVVKATGHGSDQLAWAAGAKSGGQGPLYMTIPAGATVLYYDGAAVGTWTASAGSLPAGASQLLYASNRMWAIKLLSGPADPNSAFAWSELGDPRNWPAANVVQLDPNDGDYFIGAGTLGPYIIVFKKRKAWVIYDLDTGANRPLGEGAGVVDGGRGSIVETPYGLVFLDGVQGPCITDGTGVKAIGPGVRDAIVSDVVTGFADSCSAAFERDSYFLKPRFVDRLYEYHFPTKTWWRHTTEAKRIALHPSYQWGLPRLMGSRKKAVGQQPRVMWVSDALGEELSSGTVIDVDSCYWTSRWHDFNDPNLRKRLRYAALHGEGFAATTLYKDFSTTTLATKAETAFASGTPGRLELLTPGVARAVQLKAALTTLSNDMRLHAYELYAQPRSR